MREPYDDVAEPLIAVPPGYDAICGGCGLPFTHANAQQMGHEEWRRFCSRTCQAMCAGTGNQE